MKRLLCLIVALCFSSLWAQENLPPIDKYMLVKENNKLVPAHWLGAKYLGKTLQEPINIVIVDALSKTEDEAKNKLLSACEKAGFPLRMGHSSGYFTTIDGKTISQFDPKPTHAFSDAPFELNNNHGRIFGPFSFKGKLYFVAAFSRENVAPLKKVKHQYNSFNYARDRFAEALDEKTSYQKIRFVNLENAILQSNELTTGDHDGIAVVLELK